MLKHILMIVTIAAVVASSMGTASASLSQPDVVYFGTAISATVGNTIAITPAGSTSPLATCMVGIDRTYLLRVPMDDVGTRIPGTARQGDAAFISINGVQVTSVVIPKFGTIVSMELGARTAEQWAIDNPGDNGSGDMNRNGKTDLQDYLDGNDPANCVWVSIDATHAETTVYHPKVLGSCLQKAGEDQKHNLIRVARGTHAGNFSYKTEWQEYFDLTLIGGYDPAGNGERSADPALTVLDGDSDNDQISNGVVLSIDTDTGKSSGKVKVEGLTFKNGKAPAGQNGGAIQARIYQGELNLVGNTFTGNSADSGGAVAAVSSGSALIFLTNNLFFANSATNASALFTNSTAGGSVVLLNNTFFENVATVDGDGRSLNIKTTTAATVDITNNIISGLAGVTGKDVYISNSDRGTPVIRNNSLDTAELLVNTVDFIADAGNAVCNPQFVSSASGNYQLGATSTCIDKGIVHAKLLDKDAVGEIRVSGVVDLGAYEFYKPVGTVNLGNLVQSYDGTAKAVTATTTPPGLSVSFTYNGLAVTPTNAGSYAVVATINDANYRGTASGTLVIKPTPTLTVTLAGTGSGSVNSIPSGIACAIGSSAGCSTSYSSGTMVTLVQLASGNSAFAGWNGGGCSGSSTCQVTMDGPKTVSATFTANHPTVRIDGDPTAYYTLDAALDGVIAGGKEVRSRAENFVEHVLMVNPVSIMLKGGYTDGDFSGRSTTSTTVIDGSLKIRQGTLRVERMVVR